MMTPRTLEATPQRSSMEEATLQPDGQPGVLHEQAPLVLSDLHKRWRKDLPPVLCGLDLTLAPGTKTWVGGRNGVGKTTMLRIAAGLIDPDRGQARCLGMSPREHHAGYQRMVAFLPAGDRGLYARLTVRRQLEFWARICLLPRKQTRGAVERAIQEFELSELADRRVDRLSMGQRQRVRVAMTFLPQPGVVLLDEPLTSLDTEGGALLEGAIADVLERDGAVLWCSPSGEHLEVAFDAHWTIADGRLIPAVGP
jgi:ABC-2 type transport system ATP-binding protein